MKLELLTCAYGCAWSRRQRDEQAQKMRDFHNAQTHFDHMRRQVMTKQMQLQEHAKKDHDLQARFVRVRPYEGTV